MESLWKTENKKLEQNEEKESERKTYGRRKIIKLDENEEKESERKVYEKGKKKKKERTGRKRDK